MHNTYLIFRYQRYLHKNKLTFFNRYLVVYIFYLNDLIIFYIHKSELHLYSI